MPTVSLDNQGSERRLGVTKPVGAFDSDDPDHRRLWWTDVGVHQNLTFPVHPDPISGMHCWHQAVRVKRAEPGDRYGEVAVDTDRSMEVFRAWNAYDDFEKQPLHGTFIIDPAGRVLWQDIGADPFEDPDFVIEEGLRLLELHQLEPKA